MLPLMRRFAWSALGLAALALSLQSCAHGRANPPDSERHLVKVAPMFPAGGADAAVIEQIQVRVLTVAHRDVPGVPADIKRTREEALSRAKNLASMARTGEHLAQLVGDYSDRPGANDNRGVLRVRPAQPEPFDAAFVRAALALRVGGVSEPLEQREGFVIIERMEDLPTGPERIGAKHILVGYAGSPKPIPDVTRSEAEAQQLAETVAARAREPGADWNALAAQYTDEPGGKTSGGDLGRFGRGQMVPPFERAAFALKVGEISSVVKSPFGFHVIQRYE